MLAMVLADFWMQGTWLGPLVGSSPQDIYGNVITVGSYVKMVGVVTAINLSDPHFGEIQVTPIHPGVIGPFVPQDMFGNPRSPNYLPQDPVKVDSQRGFHPKQLIVGV